MHSVREGWRYNGDCRRRLSCRNSRAAGGSKDNAGIEAHHLLRERRQSLYVPVRKPIRDVELLSINMPQVSLPCRKASAKTQEAVCSPPESHAIRGRLIIPWARPECG